MASKANTWHCKSSAKIALSNEHKMSEQRSAISTHFTQHSSHS